jgi:hypothetical protein
MQHRNRQRVTVGLIALATTGAAIVALPAVKAAAAAPTAPTAVRAAGCATGLLPAEVLGRSGSLKAGAPTAVWFWHDGSRYHLRVTHNLAKAGAAAGTPEGPRTGARKVFRGSITSTGRITAVRGNGLERGDSFAVARPARKKVTFRFANFARIDGLSFKANCRRSVTLNASVDGTPVTINVGKDPLVVPPAASPATRTSYQVSTAAPSPIGCPNGAVPANVIGTPGLVRALPAGAWLWHDGSGYQLRVTHDQRVPDTRPGKPEGATRPAMKVFRGSITTTASFVDVRLVRLEANDQLFVRRPQPNVITFELRNFTGIDGLRFKAACGNVTLNISVDGTPAAVHLGAGAVEVPVPPAPATETSVTVTRGS